MSKADTCILSERLEVVRYPSVRKRKNAIKAIAGALATSGYTSLDQQAKALVLNRATAWTIIRNKHKIGRLSKKTINRIPENHDTPRGVRVVVQRYLAETQIDYRLSNSARLRRTGVAQSVFDGEQHHNFWIN